MKIVAIIPALNEEQAVAAVVAEIPRGQVDRVIVVDNGSADGTADAARAAGATVVSQPERGYGAACMAGVEAAPDADAYLFLDGDHSDTLQELDALTGPVMRGEADIALGVREGDVERGAMLWHQKLGNNAVGWLIGRLSGHPVSDLPSLKVVRASTLRDLGLRERTHGWTAELIAKAAFRGLPMVEVPSPYRKRIGVSKVSGTPRGSALAAYRIIAAVLRVRREERRRPPNPAITGMLLGLGAAAALLLALAVLLLRSDGSTYKVLVAVWLWALPALGLFGLAGWALGKGAQSISEHEREIK